MILLSLTMLYIHALTTLDEKVIDTLFSIGYVLVIGKQFRLLESNKENDMTYAEFIEECNKRTIYVSVAKDNKDVQAALRERDDEKVKRLLDTEF